MMLRLAAIADGLGPHRETCDTAAQERIQRRYKRLNSCFAMLPTDAGRHIEGPAAQRRDLAQYDDSKCPRLVAATGRAVSN
jgi:hypothetical protein